MSLTSPEVPSRRRVRTVSAVVVFLFAFVVLSVMMRIAIDVPNIRDGTIPDDDFAERYVAHPWLGYLHLGPGVVYLLGAPLQLSRRFRTRHYTVHRRLGRVLLTCALVSGVFGLLFGILFAWGGVIESMAAIVFGTWFITCLVLAFRAIRSDNVPQHRRWMIRAFAVAVGIGTVRLWVGVFTAVGQTVSGGTSVAPDPGTFGVAFWLGFSMHVAFGEWWLRRTPALNG
jgi:uncharacterized membrane protein YozB (DUF420 family)